MNRMLHTIIMFGVILCGCGGAGSGVTATPPTHRDSVAVSLSSSFPTSVDAREVSALLVAINSARSRGRKCGRVFHDAAAPVVWSEQMGIAAFKHSRDMASKRFLGHTGSDGSSPDERLTRESYQWRSCGENVSVGHSSANEVVRAWLSSDGHCRNIMNPDYREIGAAYAFGSYQGSPAVRYWTLVLGSPR